MGDGVPVKKRWKIDFSSVCSKNVVSFSKAMKKNAAPSDKSEPDGSVEHSKDKQSVINVDVKTSKSNEAQNHNSVDTDESKEFLDSVESSKGNNEKILGDFSYEKYKPLDTLDDDEEELDYNEQLDDDMIHRTKYLGIADVVEMETEENSSDDDDDESREDEDDDDDDDDNDEDEEEEEEEEEAEEVEGEQHEEEEEASDREVGVDDEEIHVKEEEEKIESDLDKESAEVVNKEVRVEEAYHQEKQEIKEDEEMDNERMEGVSKEDSDRSILNTSLCFELDGCEEFKEDISVIDETAEKLSVREQTSVADIKSDHETTAASKVELFEPLSPQRMNETKTDEDQNTHFGINIIDLDLNDPSSPPLVVSKPADMKPIVKTRVTKKKKVMVIQTYNSGSEEEPEKKVRPQRRSKPSMMDLRDQHRIFNTTSFIKERNASSVDTNGVETPPEPYHPPQPVVPIASHHGHASSSVNKEEGTAHSRVATSSSDDAEDSLPLSQFVPKKLLSDKEDAKEDRKLLKKVKKRKLKKKKKDPEEPQKPVSAYALFFRDMQSSIKAEKPEASFGEISKIVANQWDALEGQRKTDYKKKTETAKKEYLKRLAAYKANKISSEPLPEMVPKPNPTPVTTVPSSLVPPSPVLSGHLYSIQQSQQHDSPPTTKTKTHHSHEEQQRQEPSIPPHHTSSNSRLDFVSDGRGQSTYHPSVLPTKPGICVNEGCTNLAIEDNRWDREYCSTECVVQHCRDAFQSWVMQRQDCFNDSTPAIY